MADYKKKPNRVKDAVRKMWKKPSGGDWITFGAAGTGDGGTTSPIGADGKVAEKKKPKKKK